MKTVAACTNTLKHINIIIVNITLLFSVASFQGAQSWSIVTTTYNKLHYSNHLSRVKKIYYRNEKDLAIEEEEETSSTAQKISNIPVDATSKSLSSSRRRRNNRDRLSSVRNILNKTQEYQIRFPQIDSNTYKFLSKLVENNYNNLNNTITSTSNTATDFPRSYKYILNTNNNNNITSKVPFVARNAHELRSLVLDKGIPLKDIEFDNPCLQSKSITIPKPKQQQRQQQPQQPIFDDGNSSRVEKNVDLGMNHQVLELIEKRSRSRSKPGERAPDDKAHLALSIEGGGMRGAVSAGMASAVAVLGLSDAFDSVYGSSAGSVIGAYFVSRQMCIDVYTEVLTTAKTLFVSKKRLASWIASNLFDQTVNRTVFAKNLSPAMNISFVLDNIMDPDNGLRPLDMDSFISNDLRQPLRIVSSAVKDGKLRPSCLGSKDMDFEVCSSSYQNSSVVIPCSRVEDGKRRGLFACLEVSMNVPAAAGPPLKLIRSQDVKTNSTTIAFDAFCFEPIPYRSAVEEGATHVLALRSRPEGSPIGMKPGIFEKIVAPMYFDMNGLPVVSDFFENGGQQYLYIEDYLTLEEGKNAGINGTIVPPPRLLYGVETDEEVSSLIKNRDDWKRAHLLPVVVPKGEKELSTLSVDRDEVLQAVRQGFAAAFDLLSPVASIEFLSNPSKSHLNGTTVATLLFPSVNSSNDVLLQPLSFAGEQIGRDNYMSTSESQHLSRISNSHNYAFENTLIPYTLSDPCPKQDAADLLNQLPGIASGKMPSLAQGLHFSKSFSRPYQS